MWLQLGILIGFLPIWRYPPSEGNHNLWQLLERLKEKRPHITAEEAIERARLAYHSGYL